MANGRNFFFQAEDGIRDGTVTGVQTCALPISGEDRRSAAAAGRRFGGLPRLPFRRGLRKIDEAVEIETGRGDRSEERRVGKEWRVRWSREVGKKNLLELHKDRSHILILRHQSR